MSGVHNGHVSPAGAAWTGRYAVHGDAVVQQPVTLPVTARTQVLVAGGGTAGLTAAVAAGRAGAKVMVVERNGFLGGVPTAAMMGAFVGTGGMRGIGREIVDRLAAAGAAPAWAPEPGRSQTTPFDIEALKFVALELLQEAGVELRLYTWVSDVVTAAYERPDGTVVPAVQGVVVEGKDGRQVILADCVVDCTGDGDLSVRAGADAIKGRTGDGRMRPMVLIFRVGGLDIDRILAYIAAHPDQSQVQHLHGTQLKAGDERVVTRISGFFELVDAARAKGELDEHCYYFRLEDCWVERGTALVNNNRIYDVDGTSTADLTKAEIQSREDMRQLLAFMRTYIPGCEKAFIIDAAPSLGVRETRHIVGDYFLTEADVYANRRFPDAVVSLSRGMPAPDLLITCDVHSPDPGEGALGDPIEREPRSVPRTSHHFDLPFRCLLPRGIERLLVAGRCMSVDHVVDGSTRNMYVCYMMGQVAGTAAALAVGRRLTPRQVGQQEIEALRAQLAAAGIAPDQPAGRALVPAAAAG